MYYLFYFQVLEATKKIVNEVGLNYTRKSIPKDKIVYEDVY